MSLSRGRLAFASMVAVLVLVSACGSPSVTTPSTKTASLGPSTASLDPLVASLGPSVASLGPKGTLLGPFPVSRVVDGDTVRVLTDTGDVSVRLIGIDTPETVKPNAPVDCFGPEASLHAKQALSGTSVYLELDPTQGETDRFGRVLAYVWSADQTMFNYEMVLAGFATEYTYDKPYAYQREFQSAEADAQAAGRGLWSATTCDGEP